MAERKIVGWFYRNGKRIPIFEKSGSVEKRNNAEKSMAQAASYLNNRVEPQKSETKLTSKEADKKSRAYKGRDIAVEKYYDTYEPSVAKYKGIVGKRDKDGNFIGKKEQKGFLNEGEADRWGVGTISEDNRRSSLRENVKARDLKGRPLPLQNVSEGPMDRAHARAEVRNTGRVIEDPKGNQYRPLKRTGIQYETKLNNQLPGDQTMSDIRAGNYGKKAGTGRRTKIKDRAKERKYQNEARSNTIKTIARIDAGLSNAGVMMDKAKAREKRDRLEASLKSDFYKPRPSNVKRGEGKLRAHYQDDKAGAYYKDYNSTDAMNADIAEETKKKTTDLITTKKAGIRSARRKTPIEATIKKPVATGKGSLRTKPAQDQARLDRVGKGLTKAGAKLTAADMEYYVNQKRSNKAANNSEMRRRMWGTPGVPGKEKPTLDIRGKRRSSYDIPQRRAFADKPIEESYIKYVMKEYGFSRADAIKLIKDKREGK